MGNPMIVGVAAALAAALFGVAWQLLTRLGVSTTLGPVEMALLRYGIPAIVLLPLLWQVGLKPAGVSWPRLAMILIGGGLPFGLLVLAGAQLAPAAHLGVFMAGTMPVFTALACRLVLGERIAGTRWGGFALIVLGVGWLGWDALGQALASWRGDLLFIIAAIVWAGYTVAFRGCGLTPYQGAAVINAWSLLALLALLPWTGAPRLLTAPWRDILLQAFGQGVLAGLLGFVAYMAAVQKLGSARAALSSALVPPLTALGAAWFLGEPAGPATWGAALLVACGIALASGAWQWRRTGASLPA